KLPEHMVPSAFVFLGSVPLDPNGKLDRRALPLPEGRPSDQGLVPPRNDLEKHIAAIWREVLHLEEVGVHDNFFDLGGHSLTLLRVHARLRETVTPEVKIVDLFKYSTISALVGHLSPVPAREPSSADLHQEARREQEARPEVEAIAIIGMAGRFPG